MLVIPIALFGGLIIGWFANVVFKVSYYHQVILNVIIGVAGAGIAGYFFAPVFGRPSIISGTFSLGTVFISLFGSALLLLIVNLVRRAGSR